LGGDEGRMELSATVAASVDEAARTVARLVTEFLETPEFS
jgi:hypothetical protein